MNGFANFYAVTKRLPSPLPDAEAENYWRSLNRQMCNKEQPTGDNPWKGGGCDGVLYKITTKIDNNVSSGCSRNIITRINSLYGPIQAVFVGANPNPPTQPNRWSHYITARKSPTGPIVTDIYHSFTFVPGVNCDVPFISDVQIVRADGSAPQPCDEGFLPPPSPRPGWNNITINNFTWVNNNGDTINEGDLDLTFGFAYFNGEFEIEIPVKIDVGGINFNGTFNFEKGAFEIDFSRDVVNNNGDIVIRQPDGDDRELPPADPDSPDDPDDVPDDPDVIEDDENPDGDEEGDSRILAAVVRVSAVNNKSIGEFFQTRNPNIAIPNYGYISFFVPTGDGEAAWTADIPVKNKNQFIPCPWPDGAIAVRGTARQGVSWTIQALRATVSSKIQFP